MYRIATITFLLLVCISCSKSDTSKSNQNCNGVSCNKNETHTELLDQFSTVRKICSDQSACSFNEKCYAGKCQPACNTDADCQEQKCHPALSLCLDQKYFIERCDGIDNDGNNQIDEGFDFDGDGFIQCAIPPPQLLQPQDCNDRDPKISPNETEKCGDQKDNNCNGQIDEECVSSNNVPTTDDSGNHADTPIDNECADGSCIRSWHYIPERLGNCQSEADTSEYKYIFAGFDLYSKNENPCRGIIDVYIRNEDGTPACVASAAVQSDDSFIGYVSNGAEGEKSLARIRGIPQGENWMVWVIADAKNTLRDPHHVFDEEKVIINSKKPSLSLLQKYGLDEQLCEGLAGFSYRVLFERKLTE